MVSLVLIVIVVVVLIIVVACAVGPLVRWIFEVVLVLVVVAAAVLVVVVLAVVVPDGAGGVGRPRQGKGEQGYPHVSGECIREFGKAVNSGKCTASHSAYVKMRTDIRFRKREDTCRNLPIVCSVLPAFAWQFANVAPLLSGRELLMYWHSTAMRGFCTHGEN